MSGRGDRLAALLPPAVLAVTALAVVPGLSSPFHLPKLAALAAGALAAVAAVVARGARRGGPASGRSRGSDGGAPSRSLSRAAAAWGATAALSACAGFAPAPAAVWRELSAATLLAALVSLGVERRALALGAAATGSAVAMVALLQAGGVDPFAAAGWVRVTPGARLAVYGTLGNPDFVASWLVPALLLAAGELAAGGRWPLVAGAGVMVAALLATGSFATSLALLGAAATAAAALRGARRRVAAALLLLAAAGALAFPLARGRDLRRALAGRSYLLRVAGPHVADAPLLGGGPGSFEVLWPAWEAAALARGALAGADRGFVAPQDHAHCDPLERTLETGAAGAAALGAVLFLALGGAIRTARRAPARAEAVRVTAVACALGAVVARSLVDFPLARPADLAWTVLLAAAATSGSRGSVPQFQPRIDCVR